MGEDADADNDAYDNDDDDGDAYENDGGDDDYNDDAAVVMVIAMVMEMRARGQC